MLALQAMAFWRRLEQCSPNMAGLREAAHVFRDGAFYALGFASE